MAGCIHKNLELVCTDETGVPYYRCLNCEAGLVIDLMHEVTESILSCHIQVAKSGVLENVLATAVAEHEKSK